MRELIGFLRPRTEIKPKKISNQALSSANLSFVLANTSQPIKQLDFDTYFVNFTDETIFIFPFEDSLYTIVQKKWEFIQERGILKWNELNQNREFVEHSESMIKEVVEGELYQQISAYFPFKFKVFEIPFYFISHIRETYISCEFGARSGKWEIRIHPAIELRNNKLTYTLNPDFALRNYQANAIKEWHRNQQFGTIALATAGGKTMIALQAMVDIKLTTLIAVPTIPLLQWREEISKNLHLKLTDIGVFYGNRKQIKPITIGTYNSLERYMNFDQKAKEKILAKPSVLEKRYKEIERREYYANFLKDYYSFLVFDESHHVPAPLFRHIALQSKALNRLSLSATVERFDHNESLLYFASGQKIFELNYLGLCEEGWVVPFFYKALSVKLAEDEIEIYKRSDLEGRQVMTFFNEKKLNLIKKIVFAHLDAHHQILIFASRVKACLEIYTTLKDLNIKAGVILSKKNQKHTSKITREITIDQFRNKEIDVAISTTVLDEGFNVPECCCGIIVSGSASDRQLIQRIGRIVRKSPSDPMKIGYIYELITECAEFATIDQANYLLRNCMIDSLDDYAESKVLEPMSCWIFNYDLIASYALKKCRVCNIKQIEPNL
jgi:superfamily II DNA or RNA helicase